MKMYFVKEALGTSGEPRTEEITEKDIING